MVNGDSNMIEKYKIGKSEALSSLLPDGGWGVKNDIPIYFETVAFKPTDAEIDAEVIRLQAEYDALEYARNREPEYPTIEECVHAILDDDLTALQAKRQAVKDKYPKG